MKLEIDIACPHCGREFREKVESLRPGRSRTCAGCGALFKFEGDDGRNAQRALDQLERTLRNLGRKLR